MPRSAISWGGARLPRCGRLLIAAGAAQASGVGVSDDCVTQFNDLKLKHALKYIVYTMNDKLTEITVLKTATKDATYDEFMKEFPEDKCRYGVCDCEYTDPKTGGQRNKIAFFVWYPSLPTSPLLPLVPRNSACLSTLVRRAPASEREGEFFIENLLVRIHLIIVMMRWTGLAPWEFEFPFPGSLTSTSRSAGAPTTRR